MVFEPRQSGIGRAVAFGDRMQDAREARTNLFAEGNHIGSMRREGRPCLVAVCGELVGNRVHVLVKRDVHRVHAVVRGVDTLVGGAKVGADAANLVTDLAQDAGEMEAWAPFLSLPDLVRAKAAAGATGLARSRIAAALQAARSRSGSEGGWPASLTRGLGSARQEDVICEPRRSGTGERAAKFAFGSRRIA